MKRLKTNIGEQHKSVQRALNAAASIVDSFPQSGIHSLAVFTRVKGKVKRIECGYFNATALREAMIELGFFEREKEA